LNGFFASGELPGLAYGLGRSYGDVCLNSGGNLWVTSGLDHLRQFDEDTGRLVVEAGVKLQDIQRLLVPRGWMLPVTPGTQMLTVGGAIANDVHGKNHHVRGSFGDHVRWLHLLRTDGEPILCSPDHCPEWFHATIGGLGLTGVIVAAELQLKRVFGPWLEAETLPYRGLDRFFELADASEADWEHTVSWIDCLSGVQSKGLFMRANPINRTHGPLPGKRKRSVPFVPPFSLVNRLTLFPFNFAYYGMGRLRAGRKVVHYEPFFYPLDNLLNWNRMYGPKGFYQYQSVVPRENALEATRDMLQAISRSGEGSFLAVLKTFGDRKSPGLMSFARPGVTLALDFPNRNERTYRLFERLDSIVMEARGAIYPAKDARMPRALFEAGYPYLNEFLKFRDPGISSGFSRRLFGS
jgi:FAD/FMN-containing dehydrogenase